MSNMSEVCKRQYTRIPSPIPLQQQRRKVMCTDINLTIPKQRLIEVLLMTLPGGMTKDELLKLVEIIEDNSNKEEVS